MGTNRVLILESLNPQLVDEAKRTGFSFPRPAQTRRADKDKDAAHGRLSVSPPTSFFS